MPFGLSTLAGARVIIGADPAANAEVLATVPTGKTWHLLLVAFTNVQGGSGTSLPDLVLDDGTNVLYQAPCASSAQNTSVTARYFVAPGLTLGAGGAATRINSPLPTGVLLPSGSRVRTVTAGLSATTDYGPPALSVIEYG